MTRTMKHIFVTMLLAVFVLAGCQHPSSAHSGQVPNSAVPTAQEFAPAVTDADIGKSQTWGGIDNVVSVKHLFLSAQPDAAALRVARDHGVGVVINLREPTEFAWDEAAQAKNLGLTYYNVPIAAKGSGLNQESMRAISKLVEQHHEQKILLHCSSGNRAGAWLAVHLANDHGMPIEASIALARQAGLTKQKMETRVRTYLGNSDLEES